MDDALVQRLFDAAQAARAQAYAPVFDASWSARRCWTSRAASTPAATSRTRPTRKACAPKAARCRRWCWPAGAACRRCWWWAKARALCTPCGGCRQKLREFGGDEPARAGGRPHRPARKIHPGRTAARQLRPRPSEGPPRMTLDASIQASRSILADRLGDRRPDVAILLGSGWGAVADQVQGRHRPALCRPAGLSAPGRGRPCRRAALGHHRRPPGAGAGRPQARV